VEQGIVQRLIFVEPSKPGLRAQRWSPRPGIDVLRPPLLLPKRSGGFPLLGAALRAGALRGIDALWINDATLGRYCISRDVPAVHDVTDDWRSFDNPPRIRRRIIEAEDALAGRARTIVCSSVLAERWAERYGDATAIVHNGVDTRAFSAASARDLGPDGPHVGYVGTIHRERVDLDLVAELAASGRVGTVHLVGPLALDHASEQLLRRTPGVIVHGAVPASEVPSWLKAMDVLLSPHVVSDFTLSLDAIKSYEYAAAGRPVVATATSGFQHLGQSVDVVTRQDFLAGVIRALAVGTSPPGAPVHDWATRAQQFWSCFPLNAADAL
jgi:glycosyltransferase involved in cell wall biosynthesis